MNSIYLLIVLAALFGVAGLGKNAFNKNKNQPQMNYLGKPSSTNIRPKTKTRAKTIPKTKTKTRTKKEPPLFFSPDRLQEIRARQELKKLNKFEEEKIRERLNRIKEDIRNNPTGGSKTRRTRKTRKTKRIRRTRKTKRNKTRRTRK